jgi:DNA-binding transcriptional LysR family regulator
MWLPAWDAVPSGPSTPRKRVAYASWSRPQASYSVDCRNKAAPHPTTNGHPGGTLLAMELRHFRYFVAVAEELHFRRAAERLHVAQPAVSEQVRKLEEELGVRLFDRTQRSVSLTDAGAALLEEARRVLHQADVAAMAARNARDRATTRLRIGHVADALPASVARAMQIFGTSSPRVQIALETGPARRLIGEVRAQRLDAAVVGVPAPTSGLRATVAGHQGVVAALPVTHPQAVEQSVSLERLAPERLVMLPSDTNPAFHGAVVSLCRDAGLSPSLVEVSERRVEHVLLAVAAWAGLALLPESAAAHHVAPGVRFVPLAAPDAAIESVVLTHPNTENLATVGFLRALSQARESRRADVARPALAVAA